MGYTPTRPRHSYTVPLQVKEKALILYLKPNKDLSDLLQIAKVEGRKLLKCRNVKIADMFRRSDEKFVVVVQNADVGIENMKSK